MCTTAFSPSLKGLLLIAVAIVALFIAPRFLLEVRKKDDTKGKDAEPADSYWG
jgi:hypothetical protein